MLLGVELREDLWVPQPPSGALAMQGANLIANLSASDEYVSKAAYRRDLVAGQSARCVAGYVYAGAGVHESTTDLVFSGATLVAENGGILAEGERFARESVLTVADVDVEKLNAQRRQNMSFENQPGAAVQSCPVPNAENDLAYRMVDPHPFVPAADAQRRERCKEIFLLQASGLAGRLEHVGSKGCVLGISGGLDSTLALLVAVRAMELLGKPASAVLGVTMPGFGTTDRTYRNALDLMEALGVTRREISIADACVQHMADIGHDPSVHDITYENTQARERTQILFDLANKEGCLLVGTGDLQLSFLGSGASVDAIMHSLKGSGSIALSKGEILGLDIAGMLRTMDTNYVGAGQKTIFDAITATFQIAQGVLTNDDLAFSSEYLTAAGKGWVGLGERNQKYRISATALAGAVGEEGITAPLIIGGTWAKPTFALDLAALAEQKLGAEKARLEAVVADMDRRIARLEGSIH